MSSDARAPEAGTRDGLSGPLVPDAADQVLRQATVEPGRAYRRALELGEHARRGGDARSAAVCAHAAGVAAQQLGRIDDAIEQYRRAIRIAGPAGFVDVALETATVTRKGERSYPIFLATGRTPG